MKLSISIFLASAASSIMAASIPAHKVHHMSASHRISSNATYLEENWELSDDGYLIYPDNFMDHGWSELHTAEFKAIDDAKITNPGFIELARQYLPSIDRLAKFVKRATFSNIEATWYNGKGLLNPSCARSGWSPHDQSQVAAIPFGTWPGGLKCGSFLALSKGGSNKVVVVRVVDTCAACRPKKHIDLTLGAFAKLFPKKQGVGYMRVKMISAPKRWPKDNNLFGPKKL